jgi:hypothetical protein
LRLILLNVANGVPRASVLFAATARNLPAFFYEFFRDGRESLRTFYSLRKRFAGRTRATTFTARAE